MTISTAKHTELKKYMATQVEQFITDGLQDWARAGDGAISDARDPDYDDSGVYWWLALAGNLLWAATVFFPPAAAVAEAAEVASGASRLAKVSSIVGATIGSDTAGKLFRRESTEPNAKAFLRDTLAKKQDELCEGFIGMAADFIDETFSHFVTEQMLRMAQKQANNSLLNDDDVDALEKSPAARHEARNFVLAKWVFPGVVATGANLQTSLRLFMRDQMNGALASFNRQYNDWKKARNYFIGGSGNLWGATENVMNLPQWEKSHAFNPHIVFGAQVHKMWFPFGHRMPESRLADHWTTAGDHSSFFDWARIPGH